MKKLMFLMAALAAATPLLAAEVATPKWGTFEGRNWPYYVNNDGTAMICSVYDYANGKFVCGINPLPTGTVNIPSALDGKKVTVIGQGAFDGCADLKQVNFPSSLVEIEPIAFRGTGLEKVTVNKEVTTFGQFAFKDCANLTELTLPAWCKTAKVEWYSALGLNKKVKLLYHAEEGGGEEKSQEWKQTWKKARTLRGKVTTSGTMGEVLLGIIELKLGKANKSGVASISAKITDMGGKKTSYKARKEDVTGETTTVKFPGLTVTIKGEEFSGDDDLVGGMHVESADVGGEWKDGDSEVEIEMDSATEADLKKVGLLTSLLPKVVAFTSKKSKWSFSKATSVKVTKDKNTKQYALEVDMTKGRTNLPGMTISYTYKTGQFKGSANAYTLNAVTLPSATKPKLKKNKLKVFGMVVGGKGYGYAQGKVGNIQVKLNLRVK